MKILIYNFLTIMLCANNFSDNSTETNHSYYEILHTPDNISQKLYYNNSKDSNKDNVKEKIQNYYADHQSTDQSKPNMYLNRYLQNDSNIGALEVVNPIEISSINYQDINPRTNQKSNFSCTNIIPKNDESRHEGTYNYVSAPNAVQDLMQKEIKPHYQNQMLENRHEETFINNSASTLNVYPLQSHLLSQYQNQTGVGTHEEVFADQSAAAVKQHSIQNHIMSPYPNQMDEYRNEGYLYDSSEKGKTPCSEQNHFLTPYQNQTVGSMHEETYIDSSAQSEIQNHYLVPYQNQTVESIHEGTYNYNPAVSVIQYPIKNHYVAPYQDQTNVERHEETFIDNSAESVIQYPIQKYSAASYQNQTNVGRHKGTFIDNKKKSVIHYPAENHFQLNLQNQTGKLIIEDTLADNSTIRKTQYPINNQLWKHSPNQMDKNMHVNSFFSNLGANDIQYPVQNLLLQQYEEQNTTLYPKTQEIYQDVGAFNREYHSIYASNDEKEKLWVNYEPQNEFSIQNTRIYDNNDSKNIPRMSTNSTHDILSNTTQMNEIQMSESDIKTKQSKKYPCSEYIIKKISEKLLTNRKKDIGSIKNNDEMIKCKNLKRKSEFSKLSKPKYSRKSVNGISSKSKQDFKFTKTKIKEIFVEKRKTKVPPPKQSLMGFEELKYSIENHIDLYVDKDTNRIVYMTDEHVGKDTLDPIKTKFIGIEKDNSLDLYNDQQSLNYMILNTNESLNPDIEKLDIPCRSSKEAIIIMPNKSNFKRNEIHFKLNNVNNFSSNEFLTNKKMEEKLKTYEEYITERKLSYSFDELKKQFLQNTALYEIFSELHDRNYEVNLTEDEIPNHALIETKNFEEIFLLITMSLFHFCIETEYILDKRLNQQKSENPQHIKITPSSKAAQTLINLEFLYKILRKKTETYIHNHENEFIGNLPKDATINNVKIIGNLIIEIKEKRIIKNTLEENSNLASYDNDLKISLDKTKYIYNTILIFLRLSQDSFKKNNDKPQNKVDKMNFTNHFQSISSDINMKEKLTNLCAISEYPDLYLIKPPRKNRIVSEFEDFEYLDKNTIYDFSKFSLLLFDLTRKNNCFIREINTLPFIINEKSFSVLIENEKFYVSSIINLIKIIINEQKKLTNPNSTLEPYHKNINRIQLLKTHYKLRFNIRKMILGILNKFNVDNEIIKIYGSLIHKENRECKKDFKDIEKLKTIENYLNMISNILFFFDKNDIEIYFYRIQSRYMFLNKNLLENKNVCVNRDFLLDYSLDCIFYFEKTFMDDYRRRIIFLKHNFTLLSDYFYDNLTLNANKEEITEFVNINQEKISKIYNLYIKTEKSELNFNDLKTINECWEFLVRKGII